MSIRTDLAIEENLKIKGDVEGLKISEYEIGEYKVTKISILSDEASKEMNKPKGEYHTIRFSGFETLADTKPVKHLIINSLNNMIKQKINSTMVVGIGNDDITPDALGPLTADKIIATRHIEEHLKKSLGLEKLRCVSAIVPGVLGKTGIEASETIKSVCDSIKPDIIIAVDALAANTNDNLCKTIQISDTGITPGSGVNNKRKEISKNTLGIPVIAIGMPTVIDYGKESIMVTPKEIDMYIKTASNLISEAINEFLQPDISSETLTALS